MAKHKMAYAASAAALALSGVVIPTNVLADETYVPEGNVITESWTLTENVTKCYTVKAENEITIDLNGHDITCDAEKTHAIDVIGGAKVKIVGTGTVTAKGASSAALYNRSGGQVTVENGKYISDNWYSMVNGGTMEIKGGEFTQGDKITSNASLTVNSGSKESPASLTIYSGTFNHKRPNTTVLKNEVYANIDVKGGSFNGEKSFMVQSFGTVTIEDGTFTNTGGSAGKDALFAVTGLVNDDPDYAPGIITVKGGTFEGTDYIARQPEDKDPYYYTGSFDIQGGDFGLGKGIVSVTAPEGSDGANPDLEGEISGGTFTVKPDAKYLAENHVAYETIDEKYGVAAQNEFGVAGVSTLELVAGQRSELSELVSAPSNYGGWEYAGSDMLNGSELVVPDKVDASKNFTVTIAAEDADGETIISKDIAVTVKGSSKQLSAGTVSGYNAHPGAAKIDFSKVLEGDNLSLKVEKQDVTEDLLSQEPTLKAFYDISVVDGNGEEVKVKDNDMTVTINYCLDKEYDYFQIAYIDKNGKVAEYIDVDDVMGFAGCNYGADGVATGYAYALTFKTNHLSGYGAEGSDEEFEKASIRNAALANTPDTGALTDTNTAGSLDTTALIATVAVMTLATAGMEIALWKKRQANKQA